MNEHLRTTEVLELKRSLRSKPGSSLLPQRESEVLAHSLLSYTSLNFTFYRKAIPVGAYKNIFPALYPLPDLSFGAFPLINLGGP
jgi:hypothetical protein